MGASRPAVGFIFVTLFLDVLGLGLVIPILPRLITQLSGGDLSAASGAFGALAALYALMQFLFAPVLGSLSDRYGRRPVILVSLLGSGLDYLLLAFAPSLGWFYLGRLVAGITGANFSAASAYIADVSPPEQRAANFGLIGAAFGLGFIAGPALGGLLGNVGLRVPFLVAAGLTLLNWLYGLAVLPESLPAEQRRPFAWSQANPVASLAALGRNPLVGGLATTFFLMRLSHASLESTWVLYAGHRYGWGVGQVGLSLAAVGVCSAVVQGGLSRALLPRLGDRRAVQAGLALAVLAMLGYGTASQGWMIFPWVVVDSFSGLAGPAVQSLISRSVPANEQGAIQGALTSLASVAGVLGPPLFTGLFGYFISPAAPAYLPGAAFLASALLTGQALLMARRAFRKLPEPSAAGAASSAS